MTECTIVWARYSRKGLSLFCPEEADGLIGIDAGEARHVIGLAHRFIVVMKCDARIIVGTKRPPVVIEALCIGHAIDDRRAVGDVPLADASGRVSDLFELFGDRDFVGGHRPAAAANRVAAGEQSRARGPANHLRVKAGETRPFLVRVDRSAEYESFLIRNSQDPRSPDRR